MKRVFYFSIILVATTMLSCSDNGSLQDGKVNKQTSLKKEIFKKRLDKEFNISEADYKEFVDNLIFDEKGNIIGAIYDKIEKKLDDNSSDKFWSNFDLKVRKEKGQKSLRSARLAVAGKPVIFQGYKPKRGGCKANNRWICVIREY